MAISREGKLYSWGDNSFGQLGNGNLQTNYPRLVAESNRCTLKSILENVVSVSCGANHTMVLTKDGKLFSWGCDHYGQLGMLIYCNIILQVAIKFFKTKLFLCVKRRENL
jgi:alpha-tubulin suppressor-like RCC1 family protein